MSQIFSDQINEITKALSAVQGSLKHASKDNNNPFFKSKYADLGEVWRTCQKLLSDNNLAVIQLLEIIEGQQALTTILSHSSGQWMRSTAKLPISKPGAQEIGSCITYFRRYCLAAIVGVYQDDDDGEADAKQYEREKRTPATIEKPLSDKQRDYLDSLLRQINDEKYVQKLEEHLGVIDIFDIKSRDFDIVMKSVKRKLQEARNDTAIA